MPKKTVKSLIGMGLVLILVNGALCCTPYVSHISAKFLSGRIVDEKGREFPDQRVVIYKNADYREIVAEARSDEKGRFRFENVSPGKYMLRTHWEYSTASVFAVLKVVRATRKKADTEIVITVFRDCDGLAKVEKLRE